MIYLFHGLDEIPPTQFQKLLNILPRERQQYILHYRRIEDQKRSAMGWLLLCHGLYQEYGIADLPPLDFTSSGKPFFLQKALPFFNISHSGSSAACALYHEEIGLDVQKLTTPRPSLIETCVYRRRAFPNKLTCRFLPSLEPERKRREAYRGGYY